MEETFFPLRLRLVSRYVLKQKLCQLGPLEPPEFWAEVSLCLSTSCSPGEETETVAETTQGSAVTQICLYCLPFRGRNPWRMFYFFPSTPPPTTPALDVKQTGALISGPDWISHTVSSLSICCRTQLRLIVWRRFPLRQKPGSSLARFSGCDRSAPNPRGL